jgi:hypothetical protein
MFWTRGKIRHTKSVDTEYYAIHDFPYRIVQVGRTLDTNKCHIHQGSDAIFELIRIWPAAHNSGFLTTLNTRVPDGNQVRIEPDERWGKMEYTVTALICLDLPCECTRIQRE